MVDERWAENTEDSLTEEIWAEENWVVVECEVEDIQEEEGSLGETLAEENRAAVGELGER